MITIIKRNKNIEDSVIKELAKKHNTTTKVIELLLNRGYEEQDLHKYIQTNNFYMAEFNSITNCTKGAKLIQEYMDDDNASIYVYGDYDCDGIMAINIMQGALTAIKNSIESKVKLSFKTPNRMDGYGLSLSWCKKTFPRKVRKKTLVITVDNGITKKEEVEYLKSKGVEVLITDHHAPKQGYIPNCLIVDPWLNDTHDENSLGLCGASVAFKVCGELLNLYEDDSNFIFNYLPNAAIATITDIMPATQENIGIVGYGLWLIKEGYANDAIMYYKNYVNKDITVKDIAFEIGPQINACGRMGKIEIATEFMNAIDEDNLEDVYNTILTLNDERKEMEKRIVSEVMKNDYSEDLIVIAYIQNLGGLGGTVASKLVEAEGKPVILLTGQGDILHGSARSAGGINLHALFSNEVELGNMIDFGGHHGAAGVTVAKDKINDLRESINKVLATLMLESDIEVQEDITIEVDDIISLSDIKRNTISPYSDLLYFSTLKEPLFALTDVNVLNFRNSSNNPNHLCLNLEDNTCKAKKNRYGNMVGKELWIWNKMNEYKALGEPKKVHLIGSLTPDFRNPKFYTFDVQSIIPA